MNHSVDDSFGCLIKSEYCCGFAQISSMNLPLMMVVGSTHLCSNKASIPLDWIPLVSFAPLLVLIRRNSLLLSHFIRCQGMQTKTLASTFDRLVKSIVIVPANRRLLSQKKSQWSLKQSCLGSEVESGSFPTNGLQDQWKAASPSLSPMFFWTYFK